MRCAKHCGVYIYLQAGHKAAISDQITEETERVIVCLSKLVSQIIPLNTYISFYIIIVIHLFISFISHGTLNAIV